MDPPTAANISSTPIHGHGIAPYSSRDLESVTNGNTDAAGSGMLKRSNSAPMINVLVENATTETRYILLLYKKIRALTFLE